MERKFKVGDLVCINFEIYPGRVRVRDFPWEVVGVDGEVVTVKRVSKRTGRPWCDKYHEDFLKKWENEKGSPPVRS